MSMVKDFARIQSRKYGLRVFMSEATGETALAPFDGWELVALPTGEMMDAVPVEDGRIDRISSGLLLMEAYA